MQYPKPGITSRLDYSNPFLYGLLSTLMTRLQKVQNSFARLVTHKREHITPVLNSLHWLPVIYRSQYKILMYTFKALQGTAPQYLEELVVRISRQGLYDLSLEHS